MFNQCFWIPSQSVQFINLKVLLHWNNLQYITLCGLASGFHLKRHSWNIFQFWLSMIDGSNTRFQISLLHYYRQLPECMRSTVLLYVPVLRIPHKIYSANTLGIPFYLTLLTFFSGWLISQTHTNLFKKSSWRLYIHCQFCCVYRKVETVFL